MADTKKVIRQTRKVRALRAGTMAQWVAGEQPSPQEISTYARGDELEIDKDTAESLVRGKKAEFLDSKEAKAFVDAEKFRLEECAERGLFLNDQERIDWTKSHQPQPETIAS